MVYVTESQRSHTVPAVVDRYSSSGKGKMFRQQSPAEESHVRRGNQKM